KKKAIPADSYLRKLFDQWYELSALIRENTHHDVDEDYSWEEAEDNKLYYIEEQQLLEDEMGCVVMQELETCKHFTLKIKTSSILVHFADGESYELEMINAVN